MKLRKKVLSQKPPEVEQKVEEEGDEEVPVFIQEIISNAVEAKDLEDRGVIIINDEISKRTLARASAKLWAMHFNKDFDEEVQIIINSPGGYLDACWAFIDTMNAVRMKIRTVAVGEIASAATMIFLAGDTRVMSPNSQAMIHHFSYGRAGNYPELLAGRKAEDMQFKRIVTHFIRHSKYSTQKDILNKLLTPHDNWMTPQEMKKHGLCDTVLRYRGRNNPKKKKNVVKHTKPRRVHRSKEQS